MVSVIRTFHLSEHPSVPSLATLTLMNCPDQMEAFQSNCSISVAWLLSLNVWTIKK